MPLPAGFENYYGILGVPAHADVVRLTTAWIVAAVVFHPECVRDRANHYELLSRAGARYRLLARENPAPLVLIGTGAIVSQHSALTPVSYNVLMDPVLRAAYNSVYATEPFLALEATVAVEQASNAMADLDNDGRFAPHFPSMWQHRQTVTRLAAQRLAAWFMGYFESSGEVLVPRLRKEDAWIVERLAGAVALVDGVAAEVLNALVRLRDAEQESEESRHKVPLDAPSRLIRAKLKTNGLPRHWAIPVRAAVITPAMKRVDRETPVLSLLFPSPCGELEVHHDIAPLDLEDVAELEFQVPAYLKMIEPKTPTTLLRNVRGWFRKSAPEETQKDAKVADATTAKTPAKTPANKDQQEDDNVSWEDLPPNFIPCIAVGDRPPVLTAERHLAPPSNEKNTNTVPKPKRSRPSVTTSTFLNSSLDLLADANLARSNTVVYHIPSPARSPVIVPATPVSGPSTTGGHTHPVPSSLVVECHTPPISAAAPEKHHPHTPEKNVGTSRGEKSTPSRFLKSCSAHLRRRKAQRSPGLGLKIKAKAFTSTSHLPATGSDIPPVPNSPRPSLPPPSTTADKSIGDMHATPCTWAAATPNSDDLKVHLNITTSVRGLNGDAEGKNLSPARSPSSKDEYLALGSPAPTFITAFAAQWAENTLRAVAPEFRVVDEAELPAGSFCRGWGVYFRDVVVWESWNGPEKHRKFLVRRAVDPSVASALASALALEEDRDSDWQEWSSAPVGFFTRLTRNIPPEDIVTVEWRRGPWGVRMLAEHLSKGWAENDEDFESDTDDEGLAGRIVPRRRVPPPMRWSAPPGGTFGSTVNWLARLFGRGKPVLPKNENPGVDAGASPTIRRLFSVKKKRKHMSAGEVTKPPAIVPPSPPSAHRATPLPDTRPRRLSLLNLGLPPHTYLHIPNIDLETLGTTNHADAERSRPVSHSPNRYAFVLELPGAVPEARKDSLDVIPEDAVASAGENGTSLSTPTRSSFNLVAADEVPSPVSWHSATDLWAAGSLPSTPVSAQSTTSSFSAGQPCFPRHITTRPLSIASVFVESPTSTRSTTPTPSSMGSQGAKASSIATNQSSVSSALELLTGTTGVKREATATRSIASEAELECAQVVQVGSYSVLRMRVARVSLRRFGRGSSGSEAETVIQDSAPELEAARKSSPTLGLAPEMSPPTSIAPHGEPCIPVRSSSLRWRDGARKSSKAMAASAKPSDGVQVHGGPCRGP